MNYTVKEKCCEDWQKRTILEMFNKGYLLVLVAQSNGHLHRSDDIRLKETIQNGLAKNGVFAEIHKQPKSIVIGIINENKNGKHNKIKNAVAETTKVALGNSNFSIELYTNPLQECG